MNPLRLLFRPPSASLRRGIFGLLMVWIRWFLMRMLAIMLLMVAVYSVVNPPTTWTIISESRDYRIKPRTWVDSEDIAPAMLRSVVAAEDANFCLHWGFDMAEIRKVIASGSSRGASTISQQTAKNVFLWQDRNWVRKALETAFTPMIEAVWSKRRILEVYLNVAEFGPGIFGVSAAAREHYGTTPDKLTAVQSARLAAILPAPKSRNPHRPSHRSRSVADGAATIANDGRDGCFL